MSSRGKRLPLSPLLPPALSLRWPAARVAGDDCLKMLSRDQVSISRRVVVAPGTHQRVFRLYGRRSTMMGGLCSKSLLSNTIGAFLTLLWYVHYLWANVIVTYTPQWPAQPSVAHLLLCASMFSCWLAVCLPSQPRCANSDLALPAEQAV